MVWLFRIIMITRPPYFQACSCFKTGSRYVHMDEISPFNLTLWGGKKKQSKTDGPPMLPSPGRYYELTWL